MSSIPKSAAVALRQLRPAKDYGHWSVSKARTQYFSLPSNAREALSLTTFSVAGPHKNDQTHDPSTNRPRLSL
ncbi:hypothetical protein E2C01_037749 [Portunus trituberculatus]|uniref:Uncharacterized protein n=1 Tax=Portunus trituberculatus TaxID=210409 RepID=A0A5B7FFE9_PORTR|nr:hypothetical protein [Portunus trituberculatus]